MDIIFTDKAPSAVGPYSQAVKTGHYVFCSGQISIDPETTKLVADDVETQTQQVFKNIRAILTASDLNLKDIVKTTVFLSDMDDFPAMNKIYEKEFSKHKPARSTVQVTRLPLDAKIEIECIAALEK